MKKLLFILSLFISLSAFSQVEITTDGSLKGHGNYPALRLGYYMTGYYPVTRLTERDSIPSWLRTVGMNVYVHDNDSTYRLRGGILNTNWVNATAGLTTSISAKLDTLQKPIVTTVAGLRLLNSRTDVLYETTDYGRGIWQDVGPNMTAIVDDLGTTIITANNHVLKRVFSGPVDVTWYGAVGDGVTDDRAAIQAALNSGHVNFIGRSNMTYYLEGLLNFKPFQTFTGNSSTFKRANQYTSRITSPIASGTYTDLVVPVVNGSGFKINQYIALIDTLTVEKYTPKIYRITNVSGNNITIGGVNTIDSSFTVGSSIMFTTSTLITLSNDCVLRDVRVNGNMGKVGYARWSVTSDIETQGNNNMVQNVVIDSSAGEAVIAFGSNNRFMNVKITNANGNGIHFSGSDNTLVDGCSFINTNLNPLVGHQGGGVLWSNLCMDVKVTNCFFYNNMYAIGALDTHDNSNNTITNNEIYNARLGVVQTSTQDDSLVNIIFSGNRVYNSAVFNVSNSIPSATHFPAKFIINQNYFYNTNVNFLYVRNSIISNNIIEDTTSTYNKALINLVFCKNIAITGNTISGGYFGVYIDPNSPDSSVRVANNVLFGQRVAGISTFGTTNDVTGNTIRGLSTDSANYQGIIATSSGLIANNNITLHNGLYGILLSGNNNRCLFNTVQVNAGATGAIRMNGGATGNVVKYNFISGSNMIFDANQSNFVSDNYDLSGNLQPGWQQLSSISSVLTGVNVGAVTGGKGAYSVLYMAAAGNSIQTLPSAVTYKNALLYIKRTDTVSSRIDSIVTTASQKIDGLNGVLYLRAQSSVILHSDGANWFQLGGNDPRYFSSYTATFINTITNTLYLTGTTNALKPASPAPGTTYYCTDCTANDASTGVTQTWNGSAWKNNW